MATTNDNDTRGPVSFVQVAPAVHLLPAIKAYRFLEHNGPAETSANQRIVADGCFELNFCLAHPVQRTEAPTEVRLLQDPYITGRVGSPYFVKRTGSTRVISVLFRPGALAYVTPFPGGLVADRLTPAIEVFGAGIIGLNAELSRRWEPQFIARTLDKYWSARLGRTQRSAQRLTAIVEHLHATRGFFRVADLERTAEGRSQALEQLFSEHIGVSIHQFASLIAFRHFLARVKTRPTLSLVQLAAASGYSNATDLWREFKRFTGTSPERFRRECHPLHDRMIELESNARQNGP